MAKYGSAINDPGLLSQLEGGNSKSIPKYGKSIDDPELIKQLEGSEHPILNKLKNFVPQAPIVPMANIASGLAGLGGRTPQEKQLIENAPQALMGQTPGNLENFEHSFGRNLPSMLLPELKGMGYIPQALSRIGGQAGWGALTSEDAKSGAKSFGGMQAAMEGLTAPLKAVGKAAELMNPMKYAGNVANKLKDLAQAGYKEAQKFYKPVHAKYDDSWVTSTPKEYLGFHPEDTQYFKPEVNKAYRDFNAEPSFSNLHQLQHRMGKYPELSPMRENVKGKLRGFLNQDKDMLSSYEMGSNIIKDKYYPYVSNDTLRDIVEHGKEIKEWNPKSLVKALSESPIVDKSMKSGEPISHPLVDLHRSMSNAVNKGDFMRYGIPAGLGALTGHLLDPNIGSVGGAGLGAILGKYIDPGLMAQAQNPWLVNALENARKIGQGVGRQAIGYKVNNR